MDIDLQKTRMMLTSLVKQAEAELANEVAALEARLDDSDELNQTLLADVRTLTTDLAQRVADLSAVVAKLSEKLSRMRAYGGGGGSAPFDINTLPAADPQVTPSEVIVKQRGVWCRLSWAAFIDLVGANPSPGPDLYADDYASNYT